MAKKIITPNVETEGKTMEQILEELKLGVDKHNDSKDVAERVKLKYEAEKLVEAYNQASKLAAYAECLEAENPMLAFIQMYQHPVVSAGVKKGETDITIKTDGKAVFDLWDFVDWCAGRNQQITVSLDWKSKANAARDILKSQVETYINKGTKPDVKSLKDALQEMFDSIVMKPGKNGNNAVIATSKNVRTIHMTCGALNVKTFNAKFVAEKSWKGQVFAFLNRAVEGKDFTHTYGDDDATPAADASDAKPEAEATEAQG